MCGSAPCEYFGYMCQNRCKGCEHCCHHTGECAHTRNGYVRKLTKRPANIVSRGNDAYATSWLCETDYEAAKPKPLTCCVCGDACTRSEDHDNPHEWFEKHRYSWGPDGMHVHMRCEAGFRENVAQGRQWDPAAKAWR